MERLNPTTKTPLNIDDKEVGTLISANEIQQDVCQEMQKDIALCKIPFAEITNLIPNFISTMPHSAVNIYSSFHSSSERLEILNNTQCFKRKFFDFESQGDVQKEETNKKTKIDILDNISSDIKYPTSAIPCVESVIAELSSSPIEGSKLDITPDSSPQQCENKNRLSFDSFEVPDIEPWNLHPMYQPLPLSITLPFITAVVSTGKFKNTKQISLAVCPVRGLPCHMFPATLSFPPLLSLFSTPIFPPKENFKENESNSETEAQKQIVNRAYNTRSRERTTTELFGDLISATEIIESNIELEKLALCCFEEFELLKATSPWEFRIQHSSL